MTYESAILHLLQTMGDIASSVEDAYTGIKCYAGNTFDIDGKVVMIQLFAEKSISGLPKNMDLGYTENDIKTNVGVIAVDVDKISNFDHPSYVGEQYTVADFCQKFGISEHMQFEMLKGIETLDDMAVLSEEWLDDSTTMYYDREIGDDSYYSPGPTMS